MRQRGSWVRPLPLLLVSALAACGGGGGPTGPVSGSMAVSVSGLPDGAAASVSVSGPGGFARALTGSQTLANLAPGSYAVAASSVTFSGAAYAPSPAAQSVTVSQSDTPAAATITYDPSVSSLAVTIGGLPGSVGADVTVTGPAGFSQGITATHTFTDLAPGTYTVTANGVSSGGTDYSPNPPSQTALVALGTPAAASVTYGAVVAGALNLRIDGMYLTQSVQTYGGAVPLVRNRDGFLRVFVTANQSNVAAPAVRVRFYSNGVLAQTMTINAPGLSTPLSADESSLTNSWNVAVPKALIQPNLSILADVDPTDQIVEANEGDNNFPASATPLAMDVHTASTFSVRFVPVSVAGHVGNVSSANKDQFLTETMEMHPLSAYDADVRPTTLVSSAASLSASDQSTWTQVLGEVNAARTADGSTRAYYGVVHPTYTSGIAGVGYVGAPAAIGWDYLPSASGVAAHEWGHNWGRNHAPCGNPGGPDPAYPYAGGVIGVYGYDIVSGALKPPSYDDLMGYCSPEWISDYTYTGVMSYREAHPDITTALSEALQPCLLVWGRIENGQPVLEPAFEIVTRPNLPARGGEYAVEGRAADGSRLFSLPFTPDAVADVQNGARQFAFAIPLAADRAARLAQLRLSGRGREALASRSAALPAPGSAPVTVSREADGRIALRWDAVRHPMLLVRDGNTGQIVSFARGGSVQLPADHRTLSVGFSNRVQSAEVRVAVPAR